jgi:hypothetical protein
VNFDPRDLVYDDEDLAALDPRGIVAFAFALDTGGGSGPPPPGNIPGQAVPILVPPFGAADPPDNQEIFVRWQFSEVDVVEGPGSGLTSTARVLNAQLSRRCGLPLSIAVEVTGGTAASTDFELRANPDQVSTTGVVLTFPVGAQSAALVVWVKPDIAVEGDETIELTLNPASDLLYLNPYAAPWRVATSTAYGPAVCTVTAKDATAPPVPEWRWAGGVTTIEVPETVGTVEFELALDGPSTTDVHVRVTSASGSPAAVAGTNFVALDEVVVIPAGQLTGSVALEVLADPTYVLGPNLEVELTGTVILGNCTDPSADTLTVEIVDQGPPLTPVVAWLATSVVLPEPADAAGEVNLLLRATVTPPFTVQTTVPFTRVDTNTAIGAGYTMSSGGVLIFAPGETQAGVTFRALANGVNGDASVELELQDGASYNLGVKDTLTITIQENSGGALEPTYIAVRRGIRTGRSLVEATMAVVPPSETLPRYHVVGTNDDCQVVGMTRNSQGRWDAVRVVAAAPSDAASDALGGAHSSYPGLASTTPIEIALGAGSAVAEDGDYPAQSFTGLRPTVVPCNMLSLKFQRELTDSLASSSTAIVPQWVGPSGAMFPQAGADLVRIEYYRVTLRNQLLTNPDVEDVSAVGTDTRCMSVEMWLKRRVDCDVVEVEGVLTNTNWDRKEPLRGQNRRVSGPVNLRSFTIENVPAGWAATWAHANPNESFAGGTVTLLPSRTEAYLFAPTASMPFRFALYNTSTSSAAEAQRILRYQHAGTSTGHYGVTRQNVWGARGDCLIDPVRAGYYTRWNNNDFAGWRGYEETAAQVVTRYRGAWETGIAAWKALDARYGWLQSFGPRGSGDSSGVIVNGTTALLPSSGYWERSWYALAASVMRQRVGHKDVWTGDEAWQRVLVEEYATNGWAPWIQGGSDRKGFFRLPQFNTQQLTDHLLSISNPADSVAMRAAWILAPTTRPWNVSTPECPADPQAAIVDHELPAAGGAYEHKDFQHCSRYAEQIEDGWWGCWSPLAWWQSMHLGAWISRGMSAHRTDPNFTPVAGARFQEMDYHPAFNLYWAQQTGSPLEKGGCHLGTGQSFNGTGWRPSGNMRSFPLAAMLMAQAYAMGGDRQRAMIVEPGGVSWFREWALFMTRFSTPAGLWAVSDGDNIDPRSVAAFGETNLAARTGAVPADWKTAFMFHTNWNAYAAWALLIRAFRSQDSEMTIAVRKLLRIPYYVRESAKPHTSEQGKRALGLWAVVARGPYTSGPTGHPYIPDLTEWLADYWHDFSEGNSVVNDAVLNQLSKFGGCTYAWREARDNGEPEPWRYLSPMLCRFYQPEENPDLGAAFFAAWGGPGINDGVLRLISAGTTQNYDSLNLHAEHTWYIPWLADMLNAST